MKAENCLPVAKEFIKWMDGHGSLGEVEWLLGDENHRLTWALGKSFVVDVCGAREEAVTEQEAVLAFLIYLSMRYTIND